MSRARKQRKVIVLQVIPDFMTNLHLSITCRQIMHTYMPLLSEVSLMDNLYDRSLCSNTVTLSMVQKLYF